MPKFIDLTGKRFGYLTVIERAENHVSPKGYATTMWKCKCDCGNYINVAANLLKSGNTKSCGCYKAKINSNRCDLTGKRFGRLTVIEKAEKNNFGKWTWKCLCDCGKTTYPTSGALLSERTKSCGCLANENRVLSNITHGDKGKRLYRIWCGMKARCNIKSATGYNYYGGRGIKICDKWKDYINFREWALNNGYTDDLTIERIDVNGNYEPDNCCWISALEQLNNRTVTVNITYHGETKTLSQWAREKDIPYKTISNRLKRGCDIEHIFDK